MLACPAAKPLQSITARLEAAAATCKYCKEEIDKIILTQLAALFHLLLKHTVCKLSRDSAILSTKSLSTGGTRLSVKSTQKLVILSVSLNACHDECHEGKDRNCLGREIAGVVEKSCTVPLVDHLVEVGIDLLLNDFCIYAKAI